ncbi:hypothetical protein D9619_011251 [Psilocybe cf. subviscida]|uniref:Uncharacterized protein n=1 Tax=Psilocybe cf. subviscida TaxID=2480587 RepID=A0A8H5F5A5_9AGAR|nr:hypothetical protein D9619_011251 [Psilocybe cf. subviscida]
MQEMEPPPGFRVALPAREYAGKCTSPRQEHIHAPPLSIWLAFLMQNENRGDRFASDSISSDSSTLAAPLRMLYLSQTPTVMVAPESFYHDKHTDDFTPWMPRARYAFRGTGIPQHLCYTWDFDVRLQRRKRLAFASADSEGEVNGGGMTIKPRWTKTMIPCPYFCTRGCESHSSRKKRSANGRVLEHLTSAVTVTRARTTSTVSGLRASSDWKLSARRCECEHRRLLATARRVMIKVMRPL